MKRWITSALFMALSWTGTAQDAAWLLEQAPLVSAVLLKVLEKCPSFSARAEVTVSSETEVSAAAALLEASGGRVRWEVKLRDIHSAQLSTSAKAVVEKLNGDRFLLIIRRDRGANFLVLPGAQAYLEQSLLPLKLSAVKGPLRGETIENRPCLKETMTVVRADGGTNQVVVWRATDLKRLPMRIEISGAPAVIRIRFREVRPKPIAAERLCLPAGLTRYESIEDLVQSVLLDEARRRLGLP